MAEQVSLEAYVLVDAYVEYNMWGERLKVFANLRNILDQDYMEVYGYNTMGFNLNAGFGFWF